MAKKKREEAHGGHGWFVTFADLMALLLAFFVMLVAFSSQDKDKLKIVAGSMREAFGVQTEVPVFGHRRIRRPADAPEAEESSSIFRPRIPPIRRRPTRTTASANPAPA